MRAMTQNWDKLDKIYQTLCSSWLNIILYFYFDLMEMFFEKHYVLCAITKGPTNFELFYKNVSLRYLIYVAE